MTPVLKLSCYAQGGAALANSSQRFGYITGALIFAVWGEVHGWVSVLSFLVHAKIKIDLTYIILNGYC